MQWRPAGWSVSASVNLPLHHKVQKFSSGTGSPGWSRKKGRKMVVCVCVCVCVLLISRSVNLLKLVVLTRPAHCILVSQTVHSVRTRIHVHMKLLLKRAVADTEPIAFYNK